MKFDMKFKSHLLLIALVSICLTGCWDREYLKDLHLAYCAAIDYTENGEIKETIELIIPPILSRKLPRMKSIRVSDRLCAMRAINCEIKLGETLDLLNMVLSLWEGLRLSVACTLFWM